MLHREHGGMFERDRARAWPIENAWGTPGEIHTKGAAMKIIHGATPFALACNNQMRRAPTANRDRERR